MTGRYDRQIALFGAEGQRLLEATYVLIVGLGGLGSHIAQQLAFLGVQRYALADPQTVDETNLNRLIGGTPSDEGVQKVDVAARLIKSILPSAQVAAIEKPISEAISVLEQSPDIVFGCVDDDPVRLDLLRRCAEQSWPYLDLATDITDRHGLDYGGRTFFNFVLGGCLSCYDELDQRSLRRSTMTPEQLAIDDEIYGVPRAMLGETGPSVVSLNGVVASLGITEFLVWRTGLRQPARKLDYRGKWGPVLVDHNTPLEGCYYCSQYSASPL